LARAARARRIGMEAMQALAEAARLWALSHEDSDADGFSPRRRSRSPAAAGSSRQLLGFGRHGNLTYAQVRRQQPGYCRWALNVSRPGGPLRQFQRWLRAVEAGGTAEGEEGDEEEDDDDEDDDGSGSADTVEALLSRRGRVPTPMAHLRLQADVLRRVQEIFGRDDDTEAEGDDAEGERRGPGRQPEGGAGVWNPAAIVSSLPRVQFTAALFSGDPYPESCPVCLEDFAPCSEPENGPAPRSIVLTPCLHAFHAQCLLGCLQRSRDCPSCRWDVSDAGEEKALARRPEPPRGEVLISDEEAPPQGGVLISDGED